MTWVRTQLCRLQKGCTRLTTASDIFYHLLAHGWWFSPGTPAFSTTFHHFYVFSENWNIGILLKLSICCWVIWFDFWCFNASFSNISAISWRPVLVVEQVRVPGENHRPWASNWFGIFKLFYWSIESLCYLQTNYQIEKIWLVRV
jgi:hypothetical protein